MIRTFCCLALPLLYALALPSRAQAVPSPADAASQPASSAPAAVSDESTKTDLLSNIMIGRIDEIAKSSVTEILERQRMGGHKFSGVISAENYAKLDQLYALQQYDSISSYLLKYPSDAASEDWIRRKANDGSVPMMWLLADRYASVRTIDLAVKWGHAALLGTMQERSVCLDGDTEDAAAKISANHPRLTVMDHGNPFLAKEAKLFAMSVLANATKYPDPVTWLCKPYSSRGRIQTLGALFAYDAIYFPHLRAKARNALRRKYQIIQPIEPLPPLPKPVKPPT